MIKVYRGTHRRAEIRHGFPPFPEDFVIFFYYDGWSDFEWKRGAGGMNCTICKTQRQAERIARYYINKDKEA